MLLFVLAVAASGVLEEEDDDSTSSPKPTARPPRPPQPRTRRSTGSSSNGSPSNRHSWAGYPSNTPGTSSSTGEVTPSAEEARQEQHKLGGSLETMANTSASTETLRKDSESGIAGATSGSSLVDDHVLQEEHKEDSKKITVTATVEPRRGPTEVAKVVAGEGDDDED